VPHKSATSAAPPPTRMLEPASPRDTLQAIDQAFLHDQLQALMASPVLSRTGQDRDSAAETDASDDAEEGRRDTEPTVATALTCAALGLRRP
jgi:hypothetical protein